uniref:Inner membrane protein n=1 Tax=Heterorhabditis bacteriophora TaxID=37862 RepID=A0A1I7WYV8_HETBA
MNATTTDYHSFLKRHLKMSNVLNERHVSPIFFFLFYLISSWVTMLIVVDVLLSASALFLLLKYFSPISINCYVEIMNARELIVFMASTTRFSIVLIRRRQNAFGLDSMKFLRLAFGKEGLDSPVLNVWNSQEFKKQNSKAYFKPNSRIHNYNTRKSYLQMMMSGYGFFCNRKLVTIFTAPRYQPEANNKGAVMFVDKQGKIGFKVLSPVEDKIDAEDARNINNTNSCSRNNSKPK